jgi:predicted transcriptional regulator of viral defense system
MSSEGTRKTPRRGETRKEILRVIKEKGPISNLEIWKATGINPNTVRGATGTLAKKGTIKRVARGVYKAKSK